MNHKVIGNNKRDEKRIDRLSSFLYQNGKLECTAIRPIKSHVFHLTDPKGVGYILKKHANPEVLKQQWRFFKQLQCPIAVGFVRFPNQKKYIKYKDHYWTITPFVEGEKLVYAYEKDRQRGIKALRRFHKDAKTVVISSPLKRKLFYVRWRDRLETFKKTKNYFIKHGFTTMYQDIVKTSESQLYNVSKLPWRRLEQQARKKGEWAHGDVAGHNFIYGRDTFLIDFDLLAATPILYDYIQLGQRFLPYLAWDIDKLLQYRMVPEHETHFWIQAMLVPSDAMREWLHFLNGPGNETIESYLSRMETDWHQRQSFLKTATLMLKSL